MSDKKLKIDLSPLWANPDNRFVIRFQDMSQEQQNRFVTRIKEVAPQATLRKTNGITLEEITQILMEINPIIFGERANQYVSRNHHSNFGKQVVSAISGYAFRTLCQAVYKIKHLKRALTKYEMRSIAHLTAQSYRQANDIVDAAFRIGVITSSEGQEAPTHVIMDIGMEDLERIRQNQERNGFNRIPDNLRPDPFAPITPSDFVIEDEEPYQAIPDQVIPVFDREPTRIGIEYAAMEVRPRLGNHYQTRLGNHYQIIESDGNVITFEYIEAERRRTTIERQERLASLHRPRIIPPNISTT